MRSMTWVPATAVAGLAVALAAGASPAKADFIFGNLTPSPACSSGTPGGVCGPNETFTSGGDTVIAHGFPGAPGTGDGTSNLTLKPVAGNGLSESGLGVQSNNMATTCTDSDCEIAPPQSVSVTWSAGNLFKDALIGSVQAGEFFHFFVQTTAGGAFMQLGGDITNTCVGPGFSVGGTDLCRWDAPAGQTRFGVAVQGVTAGDVLLTEVSTVPGPIVGAGLPGLVAACGGLLALVRRRRKFLV